MSNDRRIKFLSRDFPFPTDPTFREYRVVEELTSVTAEQIMTGTAGIWMLPVLAIVATLRSNKNVTQDALDKILDLSPGDITLEGNFGVADGPPAVEKDSKTSTGIESTDETLDQSGTQDSPTTSPEQPEDPTT